MALLTVPFDYSMFAPVAPYLAPVYDPSKNQRSIVYTMAGSNSSTLLILLINANPRYLVYDGVGLTIDSGISSPSITTTNPTFITMWNYGGIYSGFDGVLPNTGTSTYTGLCYAGNVQCGGDASYGLCTASFPVLTAAPAPLYSADVSIARTYQLGVRYADAIGTYAEVTAGGNSIMRVNKISSTDAEFRIGGTLVYSGSTGFYGGSIIATVSIAGGHLDANSSGVLCAVIVQTNNGGAVTQYSGTIRIPVNQLTLTAISCSAFVTNLNLFPGIILYPVSFWTDLSGANES